MLYSPALPVAAQPAPAKLQPVGTPVTVNVRDSDPSVSDRFDSTSMATVPSSSTTALFAVNVGASATASTATEIDVLVVAVCPFPASVVVAVISSDGRSTSLSAGGVSVKSPLKPCPAGNVSSYVPAPAATKPGLLNVQPVGTFEIVTVRDSDPSVSTRSTASGTVTVPSSLTLAFDAVIDGASACGVHVRSTDVCVSALLFAVVVS